MKAICCAVKVFTLSQSFFNRENVLSFSFYIFYFFLYLFHSIIYSFIFILDSTIVFNLSIYMYRMYNIEIYRILYIYVYLFLFFSFYLFCFEKKPRGNAPRPRSCDACCNSSRTEHLQWSSWVEMGRLRHSDLDKD